METTPFPQPVESPGKIRRRGWMYSVMALALAVLLGISHFAYMNHLEREIGHRTTVVAARAEIQARSIITADMLDVVEVPVSSLPDGPYRPYVDPAELLNDNTTALIDIMPGQHIYQNMVSSNLVNQGKRAVAIAVNPVTSTGNSVRAGNYVDVVHSFQNGNMCGTSEYLLQNVRVLAVDSQVLAPDLGGGLPFLQPNAEGDVELTPTSIVILELSPEDALKVANAEIFDAELRLIIRRTDDTTTPRIAPVHVDDCEAQ
jgi:Flp pilus assembly protein CpaB